MTDKQLSIWEANSDNIWTYKQNNPELVIQDIRENWDIIRQQLMDDSKEGKYKPFLDRIIELVRLSMLCRGVNKWLKVRRDLIAYKKLLKHEVLGLMEEVPAKKKLMQIFYVDWNDPNVTARQVAEYFLHREKYMIAKELLKCKSQIRGDLKALCYTDRWQIWYMKGRALKTTDMNTIKASDDETYVIQ